MSPSTIGSVGLGGNIAGSILGVFGAISSGNATKQMQDYQAQVAQINAQTAKQNADYAIAQGERQAQDYGMQAAQRRGQIVTAQAASGLDINSGSAKQVQQSQALVTSMDLNQIRQNAAKTAYDFDVQSVQFSDQGQLDIMAGANAQTAGYINAGSTLMGGAASVSSKWLQGQQAGLWGSP